MDTYRRLSVSCQKANLPLSDIDVLFLLVLVVNNDLTVWVCISVWLLSDLFPLSYNIFLRTLSYIESHGVNIIFILFYFIFNYY